MGNQREHEAAVGLFYDAAYTQSAEAWFAVAQQLMHVADAKGSVLQIADMRVGCSRLLATPGCEGLNMAAYAEHYVRHDLWAQMATPERAHQALLMHELVAPDVWERSEIYNDFVRPECDFFWCLGAAIPLRDGRIGMLGLLRNRRDSHFAADEAAEIDALLPHLQRSLQLTHQLHHLELGLGHARAALDAFSIGIVICNAEGKVQTINRFAEEILQRGDGLELGADNSLALSDRVLEGRLRRLVAQAAARQPLAPNGAGGALRIARREGAPLKLLVAPLPEAQGGSGGAGGVLILIDDSDRKAAPAIEALKTLFGLTSAEARLVRRLAHGDATAPEIAAEFALSPQTIRTQLKSIHRKMDVSHQAEISAIVSRLGLLEP